MPLEGEEKKDPLRMYLALRILNEVSLDPFTILQIHLTNRHSFIVLVLIMPKPPSFLGLQLAGAAEAG